MIQWIQRIHDEQCEHQPNQLNQRNHNYQRDDARKRDGNELLEALVNRHQPPLGAYLVKGRVARFFIHKRCALSFNETLMERGVREDDSIAPESSGQLRSHPAHNVLRAHRAGLTGDLPPTLEQGERRNAADAELRGQVEIGRAHV